MKTSLVVSAAFLLLGSATPASAAETPAGWTGFYAGGGIGKSFATSKVSYAHGTSTCSNNNYGSDGGGGCGGTQNYAESFANDMSDASVGIQGGYNWQFNSFIVGVEPGLIARRQDQDHHEVISSAFGDTLDVRTKQSYVANLRANIGMPVENMLLYVTGGASVGRVKTSVTQLTVGTSPRVFKDNDTQLGYVVGGGVKYHMNRNWLIGGELLYMDLGKTSLAAPNLVMPGGLTYPDTQMKARHTSGTMQVNLTYQF